MTRFSRLFRRPDPAWKPTGYTYRHEGHDPTKAEAVHQREQRQAAQRRAKSARVIADLQQERTILEFETARAKRKAQG